MDWQIEGFIDGKRVLVLCMGGIDTELFVASRPGGDRPVLFESKEAAQKVAEARNRARCDGPHVVWKPVPAA